MSDGRTMSDLDETDDGRVVAAVKQYMRMLDDGNAPSVDAFLRQHAEIAEELAPSLEGLALVHRAAEPKTATMVAPDEDFTAKPIGDFQIVGELGRGGMGVVYEAIQLSLGRHVALKVLPMASGLDEVRLQRFRNEAHAAAALHHTNIVPVFAVGSDRGVHYYAMQMIAGSTLADLIDEMRAVNALDHGALDHGALDHGALDHGALDHGALDHGGKIGGEEDKELGGERAGERSGLDDTAARHSTVLSDSTSGRSRYYRTAVRMAHQAAVAIEHAHQYGVVHRDIKPANLLLDSTGKIWVTDFGLAQVQNEASQLTRTGDPMGTLRYMSPEQAAGKREELDHRTDIYSLGVTLYELLTLRPAIEGDGYREMLNNVALHDPPAPRSVDPALPVELDTIIRKAIAKVPDERYSSAGELAEDLQAWLDDKPIAAKPPTTLERLSKWRRRNSGLVAVASGFLLLATLGLLTTTVLIWSEQQRTADALQSETEQRLQAQRSFQQARSAVDTFSSLSESELAYRPDLQDLRRSFLETSLEFYQDFVADRSDDPNLARELEAASASVEKMVEELRILESISPLRALADRGVQHELDIESGQAEVIEDALYAFNKQRQSMASEFVAGPMTENNEMTDLAQAFHSFITNQLSSEQMDRLRQIARQERLPFTFKTSEVVAALGLTREQRKAISRIIEETRPKRGDGKEGPGRGGPPRFGGRGRGGDRRGGPPGFGPDGPRFGGPPEERRFGGPPDERRFGGPPDERRSGGPPPDGARSDRFGPDEFGPMRFERARSQTTQNTVMHILEILTPDQRAKWNELIGEPFKG